MDQAGPRVFAVHILAGGVGRVHPFPPWLMEYIKNQQEHHRTKSFLEESRELLIAAGIEFDERYLG